MNNYGDAYRNYYSGIKTRVNPRGKHYGGTSIEDLLYKKSKKKQFNLGEVFIKQLIGAIVLFVLAFTIKMTPSEEAQSIYTYSKQVVKTDFNYQSFVDYIKNFDIMDYINKIDLSL